VKPAVVAPAATVVDAGSVKAVLFAESVTEAPPLGAPLEMVTVQDEEPPAVTDAGAHASPVIVGSAGGATVTVADEVAPL
jgi:hypothetical protein